MSRSRSIFAWIALMLTVFAWGGVAYAFWYVGDMQDVYFAEKTARVDAESREASATRIQSLIAQTESERARLDVRVGKGLVESVEMIEAVGSASGVTMRVDDVSEINPPAEGDRAALRTMRILGSARGSFDKLMHTALLLESLPAPVLIEEIAWEHSPGENANEWTLTVRMQLMTSSDIES